MKTIHLIIVGLLLAGLTTGLLQGEAGAAVPEVRPLKLMGKMSLNLPATWKLSAGQDAIPQEQNILENKANWAGFSSGDEAGIIFHYYSQVMIDWPDDLLRNWDFSAQNAVLEMLKDILNQGMILLDSRVLEINKAKFFVLDVRADVEQDTPPTHAQLYHVFNGQDLVTLYFMCPEAEKEKWVPVFTGIMQTVKLPF